MILPILVFSTLLILFTSETLFPKTEEKKSAEKELTDSLKKFISEVTKK